MSVIHAGSSHPQTSSRDTLPCGFLSSVAEPAFDSLRSGPHYFPEFFPIIQGDLPGIPLQFEAGTNFAYGFSSDVLGFIVEKISGKTLEEYMQENIFRPLDMKASFYLMPDLKERLFPLYLRTQDGKLHPWDNQPGTRILAHDPTKGGKAVKSMFVGTLNDVGSNSLDTFMEYPLKGHSQSNALATCEIDWPTRRKKGSAFWSGWAGTHFFIDPTTGVPGVYGTQIISLFSGAGDPDAVQGLGAFEETLYANLA